MVIVSLSSLFISPKSAVILASFVNVFGGLAMWRIDPVPLSPRYWLPIGAAMVAGSVPGALLLKIVPGRPFDLLLGSVFLITGIGFAIRKKKALTVDGPVPLRAGGADLAVGTFAGFCGGFIGINAPPLILHFGRVLGKRHLRRLLVLIFIPAAMAQTAAFAWTGQLTRPILLLGLLILPMILAGIHLGNRVFFSLSETTFKRILGGLLILISLKLILGAIRQPV